MFAAWMLCLLAGADPLACSTPTFDAGQVFAGQRLVHKFAIRNSAAAVLTIKDVRASCGCAAPTVTRQQLHPGESAELTLDVNTLSQPAGPIRWNAQFEWKCGDRQGRSTFEVTALLIREIEIEPAALAIHAQPGIQHEICIRDRRSNPLQVSSIQTDSNVIRAEYLVHRQSIRVSVADSCPAGTSIGTIAIATNDPKYPELRVPFTITRKSAARIEAYPARPILTPDASVLVQLRGRDGETVRVQQGECSHPALQLRWSEGPGAFSTLRIGLNKSKWDGQAIQCEVRVRFSSPAGETLTIPVIVHCED